LLSADERERVARFHFETDRREATAARALLRIILGQYAGCPPELLTFDYGRHGKPSLRHTELHFNLSHSGGRALLGVTRDRPLGVDIEQMRTNFDHAALARSMFSPHELTALASYPPERGLEGFFRCWTFKEAYLKGRGGGLSIELDSFDVPLTSADAGSPVRSRQSGLGLADNAHGWFVRELQAEPGFAAALAIQARECTLRSWRWPDPAGSAAEGPEARFVPQPRP
jgi:4'-phosphopantetheinyl transferase